MRPANARKKQETVETSENTEPSALRRKVLNRIPIGKTCENTSRILRETTHRIPCAEDIVVSGGTKSIAEPSHGIP